MITFKEYCRQLNESAMAGDTPVLHFHIGRGGRFHNAGAYEYKGVETLSDWAVKQDYITVDEISDEYTDGNGKTLGVPAGSLIGTLDFDGEYDTDVFINMDEVEIDDSYYNALISSRNFLERDVADYVMGLWDAQGYFGQPVTIEDEDDLNTATEDFCKDLGVVNDTLKSAVREKLAEVNNF